MSTELIDLRTLPKGTLCEATGPLRTILGGLPALLGMEGRLGKGTRFWIITPNDGSSEFPCGVKLWKEASARLWMEEMQPAKVLANPVTLDEVSP